MLLFAEPRKRRYRNSRRNADAGLSDSELQLFEHLFSGKETTRKAAWYADLRALFSSGFSRNECVRE